MNEDNNLIKNARDAFEAGRMEEVLNILNGEIINEHISVLYLKGEALYNLQRWGDSLNIYIKIIEKNPEDTKAKTYIEIINNILSFYHTDFFNP